MVGSVGTPPGRMRPTREKPWCRCLATLRVLLQLPLKSGGPGRAGVSGMAGPLTWTGAIDPVSGGDRNHLAKVRVAGSNPVVRSKKVQVRGGG